MSKQYDPWWLLRHHGYERRCKMGYWWPTVQGAIAFRICVSDLAGVFRRLAFALGWI